ncbi:MAG TPA: ABC transporter ATP-binding protein [Phycisphaerales bacterium]|nr:ABC transporter ATP-binding protein [Phycisphaerales bacterium]HMP36610.1 ABC transporter ATP-binding protein [Phycisphaerales bacterium]
MLAVSDARKRYGSVAALDGCSLRLETGEWLGLLGPNGAGKTTLVRAIAGRVALDSGRIELFGSQLAGDRRGDAALRRRLGIVPQELALHPTLTARENLEVFGRLHGVGRGDIPARIDWALEFTELGDRQRDLVRTFSGGMKRRLNLACGVLHRPEIILLDEPTVGVDPQSRQRIWEMLGDLRAGGASLLLTTHHLDEAQKLCERIVVIDHGRAVAEGTVAELVARTVGRHHEVVIRLEQPLPRGIAPALIRLDATAVGARIADVAEELPPLLDSLVRAGCTIVDVHLSAPTLHAAFIALTGRELRE